MNQNWLRWMPAVVVPVVIGAGALVVPLAANATPDLPDKTPAQVLELVGQNSVRVLSGTLEQTSALGLPELPTGGAGGAATGGASAGTDVASMLELLTGTHTARIYLDGPTRARIQVMDTLAERDLVRNGNDVWLYNSSGKTATQMTLPARATAEDTPTPGEVTTPADLAKHLLDAIDPSTSVTVGTDASVAGRPAYDLVLTPRSSDTLVGSISIAVDSATGLPLRVEVLARGQHDPAFQVAFTELSLQAPSADLFSFEPPAGAAVTHQAWPKHDSSGAPGEQAPPQHSVSGSGWDAVLELPAGAMASTLAGSPLFAQASQAVSDGRLVSTALVNVLVTTDGRVFAGSVPPDRLQAAADGR